MPEANPKRARQSPKRRDKPGSESFCPEMVRQAFSIFATNLLWTNSSHKDLSGGSDFHYRCSVASAKAKRKVVEAGPNDTYLILGYLTGADNLTSLLILHVDKMAITKRRLRSGKNLCEDL